MARKRDTGDGEPYSAADEAELEAWLERAFEADERWADVTDIGSAGMDVTAVIEWAGTIDATTRLGPEGMRRTHLDGLDLTGVKAAVDRSRAAGQAEYGRSYDAKGWHAMLAQLTGTARGRAAAQAAGLNPSRGTLLRWLSGTQEPNRRNREAIERAYGSARGHAAENQRSRTMRSNRREVSDTLTGALKDRYGQNVRLRDIRSMRIQ
jgi:hypothetical protein